MVLLCSPASTANEREAGEQLKSTKCALGLSCLIKDLISGSHFIYFFDCKQFSFGIEYF